jgi:hypothetical protein
MARSRRAGANAVARIAAVIPAGYAGDERTARYTRRTK